MTATPRLEIEPEGEGCEVFSPYTANLSSRGSLMAKLAVFLVGFLVLTILIGVLATVPPS